MAARQRDRHHMFGVVMPVEMRLAFEMRRIAQRAAELSGKAAKQGPGGRVVAGDGGFESGRAVAGVTPVGGILMLGAWAVLAVVAGRRTVAT